MLKPGRRSSEPAALPTGCLATHWPKPERLAGFVGQFRSRQAEDIPVPDPSGVHSKFLKALLKYLHPKAVQKLPAPPGKTNVGVV